MQLRAEAMTQLADVPWTLIRRKGDPRLSPHMTCSVFEDQRPGHGNRLQMLSQGDPEFLLNKCREYWDGKTIWEMTEKRRQFVTTMYNQWRAEDLTCVAFGYDPVSNQEALMFRVLDSHTAGGKDGQAARGAGVVAPAAATSQGAGVTPVASLDIGLGLTHRAIYLVEPAVEAAAGAGAVASATAATVAGANRADGDAGPPAVVDPSEGAPEVKSVPTSGGVGARDTAAAPADAGAPAAGTVATAAATAAASAASAASGPEVLADGGEDRAPAALRSSLDAPRAKSSAEAAADAADTTRMLQAAQQRQQRSHSDPHTRAQRRDADKLSDLVEQRLHKIQGGQIFLGMLAARIQPKPKIDALIRKLNRAGVRFVHMSPRSYKRSKPLAAKMGLDVGWNCAVSLKPRPRQGAASGAVGGAATGAAGGALVGDGSVAAAGAPGTGRGGRDSLEDSDTDTRGAAARGARRDGSDEDDRTVGVDAADEEWWEADDEEVGEGKGAGDVMTDQKRALLQTQQVEDVWDDKAKLPHGVKAIKKHLRDTDNVPLLVSLFTDSTPESTKGMLRIMRDYGEMVCVVGSAMRRASPALFDEADLAISIAAAEPVPATLTTVPQFADPVLRFGAELNSLSCALTLPHAARTHILLKLIEVSRQSLENLAMCLSLLAGSQAAAAVVVIAASVVSLPPVFTTVHVLWVSWVLVPMLSLAVLAAPADGTLMSDKRIPPKNEMLYETNDEDGTLDNCGPYRTSAQRDAAGMRGDDLGFWARVARWTTFDVVKYVQGPRSDLAIPVPQADVPLPGVMPSLDRFRWYWVARFVPGSLVCVAVYVWAVIAEAPESSGARAVSRLAWLDAAPVVHARAQALALFAFGLWLCVSSGSFNERSRPFREAPPWRSRAWLVVAPLAALAHTLFCSCVTWVAGADHFLLRLPPALLAVVLLWPLLAAVVDEGVKRLDRAHFEKGMLRLKLRFDTKLGMHSPK